MSTRNSLTYRSISKLTWASLLALWMEWIHRWTEFTDGPEHAIRRLYLSPKSLWASEIFRSLMYNTMHVCTVHHAPSAEVNGRIRTYDRRRARKTGAQCRSVAGHLEYMKMTRLASKLHGPGSHHHGHSPILNVGCGPLSGGASPS